MGETYDFELQPSEQADLALEFYIPFAGGRLVMQPVLVRSVVAGSEVKIAAQN